MKIKFGRKFKKKYEKLPKNIKSSFNNKLVLFQQNIFNPLLNNHSLSGKHTGYRSINVTGDWRALYRKIGTEYFFDYIGTHSELYG